jgi:hypothetical protein
MPRPGRFTSWKETQYPLHRRLGGLSNNWEDNIKIILKIQRENVDWIHVTQNRVQKWDTLKIEIDMRVA